MHAASLAGNTYLLGALALEPSGWRACQSLRGLAVLFLLQWLFDLSFLAVGQRRILAQPRTTQSWLFALVSLARWTVSP